MCVIMCEPGKCVHVPSPGHTLTLIDTIVMFAGMLTRMEWLEIDDSYAQSHFGYSILCGCRAFTFTQIIMRTHSAALGCTLNGEFFAHV